MSIVLERQKTVPAPAAPAKARRKRRGNRALSRGAVHALLVVFTLYTLMPLAWLVVGSTKNVRDLFAHPGFELGDFNLFHNLQLVFTTNDGVFGRWLLNSLLYSVVGSFAGTALAVLAGYAFDKYAFPFKEKLFGLVLVGVMIPVTTTALPLYLMFSHLHLTNTYWAVLLPALSCPFGVYLARVFSEGYVPNEVIEASRVDGASEWRIFWSVSLPMLKSGFVTIFLFTFTGTWNNFFTPLLMLSDDRLYPVTLGLFSWNSTGAQDPHLYSLVITGALITIIPLIIAFISLQRFWKSGLTAGAVK